MWKYLNKEELPEVRDYKVEWRIINMRFADDTAIIVKTKEELLNKSNSLVEAGRKDGMEIDVDNS